MPRNRLYRLRKIYPCNYDPAGPHILGNTIGNAVAGSISQEDNTATQGQAGGGGGSSQVNGSSNVPYDALPADTSVTSNGQTASAPDPVEQTGPEIVVTADRSERDILWSMSKYQGDAYYNQYGSVWYPAGAAWALSLQEPGSTAVNTPVQNTTPYTLINPDNGQFNTPTEEQIHAYASTHPGMILTYMATNPNGSVQIGLNSGGEIITKNGINASGGAVLNIPLSYKNIGNTGIIISPTIAYSNSALNIGGGSGLLGAVGVNGSLGYVDGNSAHTGISSTFASSPSTASYSEASAALGVLPVGGGATLITDEDGVSTVTANVGLRGPAGGAAQFNGKVVGPTITITPKTLINLF